jgi:signal transduction histidine kinase
MSLIIRLTLVFAFASLLIFLGGGIITYRVMEREINLEQERFLVERLEEVRRIIENRQPAEPIIRPKLLIEPVDSSVPLMEYVYSDTLVLHGTLDRIEPHLKLETVEEIGDRRYRIIIYDIIVESDDIVDGVTESLLIIYSILLLTVVIIGALSSYLLLRPFSNTLSFIQNFSLERGVGQVGLKQSSLPEFRKLNRFLSEMTQQVTQEYRSLKEFSENASHELKTPLAIIQGKIDQMVNDEDVTEKQLSQLGSIQNTISRLTRLSDAMVLLTKLDNKEFEKDTDVDISHLTLRLLDDFKELIDLKSIRLTADVASGIKLVGHVTLFEVMISNLLINAIKYNKVGGSLWVRLSRNALEIVNSGEPLDVSPEILFSRFKKSNTADQSLGLGLAIVKKICDYSLFSVEYQNNSEQHQVVVGFKSV